MRSEAVELLAEVFFEEVMPDPGRRTIRAWIGKPYPLPQGGFATPVGLDGIHGRLADIVGGDAIQSVGLSIRLLADLIGAEIQKGRSIVFPGTDESAHAAIRHWVPDALQPSSQPDGKTLSGDSDENRP